MARGSSYLQRIKGRAPEQVGTRDTGREMPRRLRDYDAGRLRDYGLRAHEATTPTSSVLNNKDHGVRETRDLFSKHEKQLWFNPRSLIYARSHSNEFVSRCDERVAT